jgi:hypothetical protein
MAKARVRATYGGPTITITQPLDGTNPWDLTVAANQTASGRASGSTCMMGYQIDDGAPQALAFTAGDATHDATWTFNLLDAGCDPQNAWHTLTIYAWDTASSSKQSTFYRSN